MTVKELINHLLDQEMSADVHVFLDGSENIGEGKIYEKPIHAKSNRCDVYLVTFNDLQVRQ